MKEGLGCVFFLVIAAAVCFGGCSIIHRHTEKAREAVYAEIWEAAPELERAHKNLSLELKRLYDIREEINKRKELFTTDEGRQSADAKIEAVDQQAARLVAQLEAIIASVEQQSMTNIASKVEGVMQTEKMRSLEAKAKEAAKDASTLRQEIERGVAEDAIEQQTMLSATVIPKAIVVSESLPAMRTWQDYTGYRASGRLLSVLDTNDVPINVVGADPRRLQKSDFRIRLQKIDGEIVTINIARLCFDDIRWLTKSK